jgi:hypothetical protein
VCTGSNPLKASEPLGDACLQLRTAQAASAGPPRRKITNDGWSTGTPDPPIPEDEPRIMAAAWAEDVEEGWLLLGTGARRGEVPAPARPSWVMPNRRTLRMISADLLARRTLWDS